MEESKAFFIGAFGMAIPEATFEQLKHEGIKEVEDLAKFNKDILDQVVSNLRRPSTAPTGGTSYYFGAKSQMRLLAACNLVWFYKDIGREPRVSNMTWNPIIKNFKHQWEGLVKRKDSNNMDTPKISKALPIIKCMESFMDFPSSKIGVRNIPLAYVIWKDINAPHPIPNRLRDKPHTAVYGLVEADLVALAPHDHQNYKEDNAMVYY
eukprot:5855479-Ditylum_brightwellii.AAC.1